MFFRYLQSSKEHNRNLELIVRTSTTHGFENFYVNFVKILNFAEIPFRSILFRKPEKTFTRKSEFAGGKHFFLEITELI